MHACVYIRKQSQPQEVRVGISVKAGGSWYVDSERKMSEMWFIRSHDLDYGHNSRKFVLQLVQRRRNLKKGLVNSPNLISVVVNLFQILKAVYWSSKVVCYSGLSSMTH